VYMRLKYLIACCLFCLVFATVLSAQDTETVAPMEPVDSAMALLPAPAVNLSAVDTDNDHGHSISLSWELSPDDGAGLKNVLGYAVLRGFARDGEFVERGRVIFGITEYTDVGALEEGASDYFPDHTDIYYKVRTLTIDSTIFADTQVFGPVQSYGQWFNKKRLSVLLMVVGFLCLTVFFIQKAKSGATLFVRRLAGIEAVDEAIGRATEMGKPILYVLGLGTAADIATIASYTILGRVAKKVAEYQTGLIVPCYDPIVMTVAQETVRTAYLDAGRPDAYKEDMVYFVTNQQFAYVAGVNGIMLRERPATNLYMGKFYAESLILAETGTVAGSIQIAGTDEISQIPFFVVACDYALIGEELYAASAYLGKEPLLLGSLKAQDYAKAGVIFLAIIGFITLMLGYHGIVEFFHVTG
jgi:uncharacterized protein DUF6754